MIKRENYIIEKLVKKKVVCDKCGKEMRREANAFMSNPPKFLYICECGQNEYVVCDDLSDEFKLEKIPDNSDIKINSDKYIKDAQSKIDLLKSFGESAGELSDGYHTFNELYHHRAVLFALICNQNQDRAWKSLLHSNPEDKMFDGMFIVGIDTPFGQVTYHYDIDPYWNVFNVKELERAPEWDGHTPQEAIDRLQKWSDTFTLKTKIDLGGKK